MRPGVTIFAGGLLAFTVLGCSGGAAPTAAPTVAPTAAPTAAPSAPPSAPPTGAPTPAAAIECHAAMGGQAVQIRNFAYSPDALTVAVGTEVAWTNNDSAPHTVTFDSGPNCGTLSNGDSTAATFSVPGTYSYFCSIHRSMEGVVIVE